MSALITAAVVAAVAYLAACAYWPYAKCWCLLCKGGKHYSPWGGSWRPCGRCRGSGRRVRVGRQLADWARNHRRT